jgi:uncharacterized protein (DUF1810 family)
MTDPYNLQRFVDAQNPRYDDVCAELRAGHKSGHWMWFIFPQIKGLGLSQMSRQFSIASRHEAIAYLKHPILGPRLRECTRLVTIINAPSAGEIFDPPDDLKLHASMTLFAKTSDDSRVFLDVLQKYFKGEFHRFTIEQLS